MSRVKFQAGLHFWLSGREYVIKQRLAGGEFQVGDVVTENLSTIKETALIQFLFKDELKFAPTSVNQPSSGKKIIEQQIFPKFEIRAD